MAKRHLICIALISLAGSAPGLAQTANPNDIPPEFITGHNAATARSLSGNSFLTPQSPPTATQGVTVYGRRRCGKRDQACIDRVSAELWTKYPEQIRSLCTATAIHSIREGFVEQDLGVTGVRNDRLTPATQRLCEYGDKLRKQQVAADAAASAPAADDAKADPPPQP